MWFCFFFNDTATTEIYTLSLHDALPIFDEVERLVAREVPRPERPRAPAEADVVGEAERRVVAESRRERRQVPVDRKSTRLNSSHANLSYAVFCLKKKKPRT